MSIHRTGAGQRFIKPDRRTVTSSTVRKDPNQVNSAKQATIDERLDRIVKREKGSENCSINISEIFSKKNSDTVFIIGGGSSLKDFDFSALKDQDTICVNKAV